MKNPNWQRDELILALDLYFQLEPGQIHGRNERVVALSDLLNSLPIHAPEFRNYKFRNANGVGLKLSNFLAIDPDYDGKGMQRYGKLDHKIFHEFKKDKERLQRIANSIRETLQNEETVNLLYQMNDEEDQSLLWEVKEGKVLYKLHKYRERNMPIVKEKKAQFQKDHKTLFCEVCTFNFERKYGTLGKDYIECHHRVPLSESTSEIITKLSDLALVCSNCHRMLHRDISHLSVAALQQIIREKGHRFS